MALTKAQRIDRILSYYDHDELARRLDISPPEDEAELLPLLKAALADLPPRRILRLIVPALTDDELKALTEVSSNRLVRAHRLDWEAAALGEPTEIERERAAVKQAEAENAVAPDAETVALLNRAPQPVPLGPDQEVVLRKWVVDEDGLPKQVDVDDVA